jgi:hypothetical protein
VATTRPSVGVGGVVLAGFLFVPFFCVYFQGTLCMDGDEVRFARVPCGCCCFVHFPFQPAAPSSPAVAVRCEFITPPARPGSDFPLLHSAQQLALLDHPWSTSSSHFIILSCLPSDGRRAHSDSGPSSRRCDAASPAGCTATTRAVTACASASAEFHHRQLDMSVARLW